MTEKLKISESEWRIMKVLWTAAPKSAKEILKDLATDVQWKENTVKTLVSRLVQKGVVGYEKVGRSFLYFPLLKEEECVQFESKHFLKKVFNGATKSLLASFIENESLSDKEIEELKALLEKQQKRSKE